MQLRHLTSLPYFIITLIICLLPMPIIRTSTVPYSTLNCKLPVEPPCVRQSQISVPTTEKESRPSKRFSSTAYISAQTECDSMRRLFSSMPTLVPDELSRPHPFWGSGKGRRIYSAAHSDSPDNWYPSATTYRPVKCFMSHLAGSTFLTLTYSLSVSDNFFYILVIGWGRLG